MRRYKSLLCITFLILSACVNINKRLVSTSTVSTSTDSSDNSCIPPITSFVYPANQRPASNTTVKDQILPPAPWKVAASLPNFPEGATSGFHDISVAYSGLSYSEIWVKQMFNTGGNEYGGGTTTVQTLLFRTDTKSWRTFSQQIQGSPISIDELYQGKNGSLFADISFSNKSALGSYNENEGQFDVVKNSENIPGGIRVLDNNGTFWILNNNDGIYSFDPITSQLKKNIDIPDLNIYGRLGIYGRSVAVAPDGSLYFLDFHDNGYTELARYDPTSNKLERNINGEYEYSIYLDASAQSLYVDHLDNVWLDDQGWMSPDGTWYKVVHSPIFIVKQPPDIPLAYLWEHPSILLESSDNKVWFRSDNGLAWLNPQKGQWCWFTTYQSNIVEDQQHNLWMIADGKLYKYALDK